MPVLKEKFRKDFAPSLMDKFSYDNITQVPRLEKIVVNMGVGSTGDNPDQLEEAVDHLARITGQQPVVTRAKKSIAAFGIREDEPVGCRVTLRGDQMYEFLYRLINLALPRIRDFRGLSPHSFDGRGNYSLGVNEQLIFPEISVDETEHVQGMDIVIVTTAETDEEAFELLRLMGMPFRE